MATSKTSKAKGGAGKVAKSAKSLKPQKMVTKEPAKEAKTKKSDKPAKAVKAVKEKETLKIAASKVDEVEVVAEADFEQELAEKPIKPVKISKAKAAKQAALEKAATEEAKKWADLKTKYGSEKASAYSMSAVYESNKPLQHKVLGWGYILSVQNDRLEVLFEQGTKVLISNYKTR